MTAEQRTTIINFLESAKGKVIEQREMMIREGFVIDNLDDRWQKLVLTLYTVIVGLSTEAENILEYLKEDREATTEI